MTWKPANTHTHTYTHTHTHTHTHMHTYWQREMNKCVQSHFMQAAFTWDSLQLILNGIVSCTAGRKTPALKRKRKWKKKQLGPLWLMISHSFFTHFQNKKKKNPQHRLKALSVMYIQVVFAELTQPFVFKCWPWPQFVFCYLSDYWYRTHNCNPAFAFSKYIFNIMLWALYMSSCLIQCIQ